MNKFLKLSISPLSVGIVVSLLVVADYFVAPLFMIGTSFIWVAFINWTVFFNATLIERMKAMMGYVVGYLSANAIVYLMTRLEYMLLPSLVASIIAVFLINALIMYFDNAKKIFLDSIPGIFVGIALTFSGVGVLLPVNDVKLFLIIMVYGVFGLLCGLGTKLLVKLFNEEKV